MKYDGKTFVCGRGKGEGGGGGGGEELKTNSDLMSLGVV